MEDEFEEACSKAGGTVENISEYNMKACIVQDMAILENGDVLPFGEPKKKE